MERSFLHQNGPHYLRCFLPTWPRHRRPVSSPLRPHQSRAIRYLGCTHRADHLLLLHRRRCIPPHSTPSCPVVSGFLVSPWYRLHLPSSRFHPQAPNPEQDQLVRLLWFSCINYQFGWIESPRGMSAPSLLVAPPIL